LSQAEFSYSVADGANWIAKQYRINLPMLGANVLDWYHFNEHVLQCSHDVYGEQSPKAKHWHKKMTELAWNQGSLAMVKKLSDYERRNTGSKRVFFEKLRCYVQKRIDMTDYPDYRQQGYDCGSGPTESQCGSLTRRIKGAGMRWDVDNVGSMLALATLDHSSQWASYWKLQRAA